MKDQDKSSEAEKSSPLQATITVLAPKESESSKDSTKLKWFEAVVSLVKAGAWPFVILFLFWQLRQPIIVILTQLPSVVSQSTKISVGNLSFEIQKTAREAGDQELAQLMEGLSPRSIEFLLVVGRSYHQFVGRALNPEHFSFPNQADMDTLIELEDKGLLTFRIPRKEYDGFLLNLDLAQDTNAEGDRSVYYTTRPLTPDEVNRLNEQEYYLTDLGKRAFDLVVAVVVEQVQTPVPVASPSQ